MKRKIYKKITKKRLDECLALVGWSTRPHGCGHYRLYNAYGNITIFMFRCDDEEKDKPLDELRLDEFCEQRPFGKTSEDYIHSGFCSFHFKGCTLEVVYQKSGEVWYVSLKIGNDKTREAAYICFNSKK